MFNNNIHFSTIIPAEHGRENNKQYLPKKKLLFPEPFLPTEKTIFIINYDILQIFLTPKVPMRSLARSKSFYILLGQKMIRSGDIKIKFY